MRALKAPKRDKSPIRATESGSPTLHYPATLAHRQNYDALAVVRVVRLPVFALAVLAALALATAIA